MEASYIVCVCGSCGKEFHLYGDSDCCGYNTDDLGTYLEIRSCESGGIYAIYVLCPHCRHEHDLR